MFKQLSWFIGEINVTNVDRPESQAGLRFVVDELGGHSTWGTKEEVLKKLEILKNLRPKVAKLDDYFLRKCTISWINYFGKQFRRTLREIEIKEAEKPIVKSFREKLDEIR